MSQPPRYPAYPMYPPPATSPPPTGMPPNPNANPNPNPHGNAMMPPMPVPNQPAFVRAPSYPTPPPNPTPNSNSNSNSMPMMMNTTPLPPPPPSSSTSLSSTSTPSSSTSFTTSTTPSSVYPAAASPGGQAATQLPSPSPSNNANSNANTTRPRTSSSSRVDPAQIPSPVYPFQFSYASDAQTSEIPVSEDLLLASISHVPRIPVDLQVPPPSLRSPFFSTLHRLIRPTLSRVPPTQTLLENSGLPLHIVSTPLAALHPAEMAIDRFSGDPLRCGRCGGYASPLCSFSVATGAWTCALCSYSNAGRRPETMSHVVEYDLSNSTTTNPATHATSVPFVIAVEITQHAIETTFTRTVFSILSQLVASGSMPAVQQPVMVILYDANVYCVSAASYGLHVMSDIDEPFLPLPVDKMLFPSMASIDWNRIASLVPRIPGSESCFGSVLKFVSALQLQREQTARGAGDNNKAKAAAKGSELDKPLPLHLVAFASCLPKVGLGKLAVRSPLDEAPQQKQFYEHLGDEYLQHSIAVDLFVANNGAYFDWATFGVFLQRCGGRTLSYCPFDATGTFAATLAHDMTALLWPTSPDSATTGVVYATYVACRVGLGLDVDGANAKVLRFARFSSHSTVSFPIKFTSSQLQDKTVGVQVACLFTTRAGREMVRVVSYPWQPANTTVSALFRAADLEPIVLVLLRSSLPKPSLYEALNEQLVGILARYRKHCTTNPSPGQLILPETLKTLPALFTAAVHSLSAFWTPVERLSLSLHVSLEDCMALVYPNVYTIDGDSIVGVRASAELVRRDAILVIENGVYVFVVGPEGSMQLRPVLDVLAMCQRRRGRGLRVRHVRDERDPLWSFAMSCLAEDSLKPAGAGTGVGLGVAGRPGALSYVEYLCGLHKQIQTRIQRETESMLQHIHM